MDISDFKSPVDRHKFNIQYVTTPTADTPGTSLLLQFDNKRYLFGRITEGTQRACIERGVSLKKARNIFLTGETSCDTNGGLLGMILTIADVLATTEQEEKQALGTIHIHGGPKIWHTIACARRFIFRTGMPMTVLEASPDAWRISESPDFYDENILLWALPIRRTSPAGFGPSSAEKDNLRASTVNQEQSLRKETVHSMFDSDWRKDRLYETTFKDVNLPATVWVRDPVTKELSSTFCHTMSDAPQIAPDQKVHVRLPWPAALIAKLPAADNLPNQVAMSYFFKGRPQRGTFNAQKAKAAGVKPGPAYGVLASGRSVVLDDGTEVKPEHVLDEILPGYGMAVLDIPETGYLDDLSQKLMDMKNAQILVDVHAFLYILGPGVLASRPFLDFLARFPDVKHVISSPDDSPNYLAMASSAASLTRLSHIRPEIFSLPIHNNRAAEIRPYTGNIIQAKRGLKMHVAPKFQVDEGEVPSYPNIPQIVADKRYKDVSVTTLGTGSAVPSKYRNVSANLLHIPTLGYFLLDCGESTLGQLKRLHTPEQLDEILCNLHMIWISHLHADHHLGTMPILVAHKKAVQERQRRTGQEPAHKLYLLAEPSMADYIEDYRSVQDSEAIMLRCLNSGITNLYSEPISLKDTTLPISKLDSTRVNHCHGAQAVSITFSNGFKISYSGDCRPSADFVNIGHGSDVLIHEATFDDGMEGDAMAKRHCTIGEALGVANAMKAKNVILTHFSQRYQKLPVLTDVKLPGQLKFEEAGNATDSVGSLEEEGTMNSESATTTSSSPRRESKSYTPPTLKKQMSLQEAAQQMSICIAFDLMRVTIPQIKDMYKYYPAIESMFDHEQSKSDEKREATRKQAEELQRARDEAAAQRRLQGEMKQKSKKKDGKNKNGAASQTDSGRASGTQTPNKKKNKQDKINSRHNAKSDGHESVGTGPILQSNGKRSSRNGTQENVAHTKKAKLDNATD
ncbi:hypothetical protein LTR64_008312 [Lithohypha guttulata]|uniref:uncharacterized protein n=1 Tax=Lithohypha guttulata TaxID=1690604 RepID=UPI002DDFA291|nr:hypothetical protein LTR51_008464 [Lithohypha guttulata]